MNDELQDPLDALLHEQNIYVEDRGFTAQVIQALPRRRMYGWRQAFLLTVSIIGWMAAARCLPWGHLPSVDISALISLNSQVLLPWLTVLLVIACLAWSTITAVQLDD